MLEELADDRADRDVLRQPFDTRQERAASPTHDVDLHTSLRRLVEGGDRLLVDDRVDLEEDPRFVSHRRVADLAIDELQEPRPEAVGSNQQPTELALAGQS